MIAGILVLLVSIVIAVGSGFGGYACLRALRRRNERRRWDDLVARHRELDRELDKIWPL